MPNAVMARIDQWKKEAENPMNSDKVREGFKQKLQQVCTYAAKISGPVTNESPEIILHLQGGLVHVVENKKQAVILLRDFDIDPIDPTEENVSTYDGDRCVEYFL